MLTSAGGKVVCGQCKKPFEALNSLTDDYPGKTATDSKANASEPPTLGAAQFEREFTTPDLTDHATTANSKRNWPWYGLVIILAVITLLNVGWVFRANMDQESWIGRQLQAHGVPGFEAPEAFRDPSRIHLVSRDIHAHPTRSGILVLSATFVNLASEPQPYPQLSVTLLNTDNQPLAARMFTPDQYLLENSETGAPLMPDVHVPVLIEFADPGDQAVGFEMEFN